MFHLRMLSSEQFTALREHLSRSGFTEQSLRQRLDIKPEKPLDLVSICTRPSANRKVADGLDAIIHLFLLGEALPVAEATSFFPPVVCFRFEACSAPRIAGQISTIRFARPSETLSIQR
jgi:hypothetical protein